MKGYEDVIIHGDKTGFELRDMEGKTVSVYTPREFAEILLEDPNYHGGDIRLCSCETGAEDAISAQILANILQVKVLAPTKKLWVDFDGNMTIGDTSYENDGEWVLFTPQRSKK